MALYSLTSIALWFSGVPSCGKLITSITLTGTPPTTRQTSEQTHHIYV